jgi:threonine aldolase
MTDDDLKRLFDSMRQENAAAHSDTRRHFEVLSEGTRKDIQLVAESVVLLSENLARTAKGLDEKIERTAAETQAMIKFSHVEIDRRMRSLEDAVADLQTRVERLEGSTH